MRLSGTPDTSASETLDLSTYNSPPNETN